MRRRDLLNAGLAATAVLAAPRIARADTAKTLRFVPTSDLAVLDPVVTFNRLTRNYAYLVFDTLYGIDTSWQAQPQMVAGHEVDDDGLTWNLRLREGLRFHDKEPVLGRVREQLGEGLWRQLDEWLSQRLMVAMGSPPGPHTVPWIHADTPP